MKTKSELSEFVSSLDSSELAVVQSMIKAKLSLQNAVPKTDDIEWALQILCEFLRSNGIVDTYPSILRRQAAKSMKGLVEKVAEIQEYLGDMDKVERHALFRLGIELLHRNLIDMQWTVTPRTLINNFHRIPACLDREFPGYARNGLLKMITRGMKTYGHER